MFSLEQLIGLYGDARLGSRLERVAFNALPASMGKDLWTHQYDQQANQVLVSNAPRDWTTNGPQSNLFGLEPNFGCCTANMHQGWPKFAASLWMATADNGLAAVAYSPSELRANVAGVAVHIVEDTRYPFDEEVTLHIEVDKPATFPILLNIPIWAEQPLVRVNAIAQRDAMSGEFLTIRREWRTGDTIFLRFPMPIVVSHGWNNAAYVNRGPLVYALSIGEKWKKLADRGQTADWEISSTTPWNYALLLNPMQPGRAFTLELRKGGDQPFSHEGTPLALFVKGVRLDDWGLINNSAGPLPRSPVRRKGREEKVTLIPYGAAKLRITEFPWIEDKH